MTTQSTFQKFRPGNRVIVHTYDSDMDGVVTSVDPLGFVRVLLDIDIPEGKPERFLARQLEKA